MMELPDRQQRDESASELVALMLLRFRAEIAGMLGDPPDFANISDEDLRRLEEEAAVILFLILLRTFVASAELHGATGAERQAAALAAGLTWARAEAERRAGLITETTRRRLREAADDGLSSAGADGLLDELFGLRRAILIASDAITAGQHQGAEFAVDRFGGGLSAEDVWHTADDPCPVCSPLDGLPRPEWEASFPAGPPVHPFCRCYVVYGSISEPVAA